MKPYFRQAGFGLDLITKDGVYRATDDVTPADELDMAAEYIQENGHVKGTWGYGDAACMLGAYFKVSGVVRSEAPALSLLQLQKLMRKPALKMLGQVIGTDFIDGLTEWNDKPSRTPSQVCDALREAAVRLRLEESDE